MVLACGKRGSEFLGGQYRTAPPLSKIREATVKRINSVRSTSGGEACIVVSQTADKIFALHSIGRINDDDRHTSEQAIKNHAYIAFKSKTRSTLRFTLLPESTLGREQENSTRSFQLLTRC